MGNQRLVYRVILKVLAVLALVMLVWVFINSLFTQNHEEKVESEKKELVKIKLAEMKRGGIQKVRLGNQEISILYRKEPVALAKLKGNLKKDMIFYPQDADFYVFYNYGDSGNCPLFYSKETFKDTCSGKLFDTLGQEINNQKHGFRLVTPPHYYQANNLFLGKWRKE